MAKFDPRARKADDFSQKTKELEPSAVSWLEEFTSFLGKHSLLLIFASFLLGFFLGYFMFSSGSVAELAAYNASLEKANANLTAQSKFISNQLDIMMENVKEKDKKIQDLQKQISGITKKPALEPQKDK
jgi:Tfp pilus assembly protein PilN